MSMAARRTDTVEAGTTSYGSTPDALEVPDAVEVTTADRWRHPATVEVASTGLLETASLVQR